MLAIDDAVSLPLSVGSSVSVCDLGTLVVASRVKVEPAGLSVLARHLASTRPEGKTVWGFWGCLESGSR